MTIKTNHFTPRHLISAPRRSTGIPNAHGTLILYSVTQYDFTTQKQTTQVRAMDAGSRKTDGDFVVDSNTGTATSAATNARESWEVLDGEVNGMAWMENADADDNDCGGHVAMLRTSSHGRTDVLVGPVKGFQDSHYIAGTIAGPAANLKVVNLDKDYFGIAFSAPANPDGSMYNAETQEKSPSTARLYNSNFVRHWDKYMEPQRNAVWIAVLLKRGRTYSGALGAAASRVQACFEYMRPSESLVGQGEYFLTTPYNPLAGTALECPIGPFGGTDHFDISKKGLVIVAKDPNLDPALHTRCNLYLVFMQSYLGKSENPLFTPDMGSWKGAMTSPVFSPDGNSVAFLAMGEDGYEAAQNQIFVIPDVRNPGKVNHLTRSPTGARNWDRSPSALAWSPSGKVLFLTAEDHGTTRLGAIPSDPEVVSNLGLVPEFIGRNVMDGREPLQRLGNVDSFTPLANGDIFVTASNMIDSSIYAVQTVVYSAYTGINDAQSRVHRLEDEWLPDLRIISSASHFGAKFGLTPDQVEELWIPSGRPASNPETKDHVHAWLVTPSWMHKDKDDGSSTRISRSAQKDDSKKRCPLLLLVHGGPQSAWNNLWSTRWNPAVFAEQGYAVLCPNPTGSTGFGQGWTDAIAGDWGGAPYEDLCAVVEHITENRDGVFNYIDTDRAVAAGASYGGYMMNWIQGHKLGRKFKALVCHDGVFSTELELATDELYFLRHEFGPWPWDLRGSNLRRRSFPPAGESFSNPWTRNSPANFTQNWATPQLVIHSSRDYRLTMADGLAAFNVLQIRGVPSALLNFPDETHFVTAPENSLVWHAAVLSFLADGAGLPRYEEGLLKRYCMTPHRGLSARNDGADSDAYVKGNGDDLVVAGDLFGMRGDSHAEQGHQRTASTGAVADKIVVVR